MTVRVGGAQHVGRREVQQDAFAFSGRDGFPAAPDGSVVAVVADGMGGLERGADASRAAVCAFLESYLHHVAAQGAAEALGTGLTAAQRAVRQLAAEAGLQGSVGTTLVAAVVAEERLFCLSRGDSRAYLMRHGELQQLTRDDTYAEELAALVAEGRIAQAEAEAHPQRSALTSYVGDDNLEPSAIFEVGLVGGEWVLLCTDGLYRALLTSEMAQALQGDPQRACEVLVAEAIAKGAIHQDNVTALLLTCGCVSPTRRIA